VIRLREHEVVFTVEGRRLRTPLSYSLDVDLLQPTDAISATFPLDLKTWEACPLDGIVEVAIDGVPVVTGFVQSKSDQGSGTFALECQDRCSRLVNESITGTQLRVAGRLSDTVLRIVRPWFDTVLFSNAQDRQLRRGRGKLARASREPALTVQEALALNQTIGPGTKRWEALEQVTRPLQLLAWSSADGKALVLARPNYDQAPQYEFVETPSYSNVTAMTLQASVSGRYSMIETAGTGVPPGVSPPPRIATYAGEKPPRFVAQGTVAAAFDHDAPDGTGGDFRYRQRLFVPTNHVSASESQLEAIRTMARGKARARTIEVTAAGHGQVLEGASSATLYAPDTLATVRKEIETAPDDDTPAVLVDDVFYVTRVSFRGGRDDETTTLSLVPVGTLLV
jgi:prophage tail gpP-like protein